MRSTLKHRKHKLSWSTLKHRKHKVSWPALKHRKRKCDSLTQMNNNDRLSELPDDVLLSILSMASFTTKDAVRTSLLSRRWKNLWRSYPILSFEYSWKKIEISKFVGQVNHVVEEYLGSDVDEFKVYFVLDNALQSHIDKWVAFALAKRVKRLELTFTPPDFGNYSLPLECCVHLGSFRSSLTSLRLQFVDIASEVVEWFLRSSPMLENLSIGCSQSLTSIRAPDSSLLKLKRLEVFDCHNLDTIDIFAPELLSLIYRGKLIRMHIRNAFALAQVSVGDVNDVDFATFTFDFLSLYLSQLEYLNLRIWLFDSSILGTYEVPALPNLKHLILTCSAYCNDSLLECTSLIEASPVLQKLTLQLMLCGKQSSRNIVKHEGRPLKCLKTLEIVGFVGQPIDLEFLAYVLDNAIAL